jgi:hypothetical protein
MRRRTWKFAAVTTVLFVALPIANAGATTPKPKVTGLGATLGAWNKAHVLDTKNCRGGHCYGAPMGTDVNDFQWSAVTVDDGIVDGYERSLPEHTTLAEAKADIMKDFPRDTVTTSQRTASSGDGSTKCYLWNLRSATLAKPLGAPKIGDPKGAIGVVFDTLGPDGTSPYSVNNIDSASVSVAPASPTATC